jgi:hypothetical protein
MHLSSLPARRLHEEASQTRAWFRRRRPARCGRGSGRRPVDHAPQAAARRHDAVVTRSVRDRPARGSPRDLCFVSTARGGAEPARIAATLISPQPGCEVGKDGPGDSLLAGRPREQVGLGAAVPLDQHGRGVVLELARLAVDDGVPESAQRLGAVCPAAASRSMNSPRARPGRATCVRARLLGEGRYRCCGDTQPPARTGEERRRRRGTPPASDDRAPAGPRGGASRPALRYS